VLSGISLGQWYDTLTKGSLLGAKHMNWLHIHPLLENLRTSVQGMSENQVDNCLEELRKQMHYMSPSAQEQVKSDASQILADTLYEGMEEETLQIDNLSSLLPYSEGVESV